jgi:uncharacterized protein YecA (UPF0149 family)
MAQIIEGNGFPMAARKINPNAPCQCGSGKKAKKCCGTKTVYCYSKLNEKQIAEEKAKEEKAKAEAARTFGEKIKD